METQQNNEQAQLTAITDELCTYFRIADSDNTKQYVTKTIEQFAGFVLKDRRQAIDKAVVGARIEENSSIEHMLVKVIEFGRDWCGNRNKYVSQCYACQTAKWTKIIAKMYLHSIKERLAQLHEQKKIAPEK